MLNKEHCKLNAMLDDLLERRKPASLNRGEDVFESALQAHVLKLGASRTRHVPLEPRVA